MVNGGLSFYKRSSLFENLKVGDSVLLKFSKITLVLAIIALIMALIHIDMKNITEGNHFLLTCFLLQIISNQFRMEYKLNKLNEKIEIED